MAIHRDIELGQRSGAFTANSGQRAAAIGLAIVTLRATCMEGCERLAWRGWGLRPRTQQAGIVPGRLAVCTVCMGAHPHARLGSAWRLACEPTAWGRSEHGGRARGATCSMAGWWATCGIVPAMGAVRHSKYVRDQAMRAWLGAVSDRRGLVIVSAVRSGVQQAPALGWRAPPCEQHGASDLHHGGGKGARETHACYLNLASIAHSIQGVQR